MRHAGVSSTVALLSGRAQGGFSRRALIASPCLTNHGTPAGKPAGLGVRDAPPVAGFAERPHLAANKFEKSAYGL